MTTPLVPPTPPIPPIPTKSDGGVTPQTKGVLSPEVQAALDKKKLENADSALVSAKVSTPAPIIPVVHDSPKSLTQTHHIIEHGALPGMVKAIDNVLKNGMDSQQRANALVSICDILGI